ncbi:holo-ACP synthase [Mycobacteroides abscessus]|uniref:holo-ACP synthase n=1 Tax=Mycobacteroides abscessus TaxID=36809 RepID=UPI000C262C19
MDLVEVARVEELMTSQPELRERVFTVRELAYCYRHRRAGEHLAGRWAAKEAVLKSLGTGMGAGMEWTDIEVINDRRGRPTVRLYGEAEAAARSLDVQHIDISLSHTAGLAVAHAVAVCTRLRRYTDSASGAYVTRSRSDESEGDDRYGA